MKRPKPNPDREKQKEYSKKHYEKNKAKIIAKRKARLAKMSKSERQAHKEYNAEYFQKHKSNIKDKRREVYYPKIREKEIAARAESGFISTTEAAAMLDVSVRQFREWLYSGKVKCTKSPGGRYRIMRADIEVMRKTQATGEITITRMGAANKGKFVVPEGFDVITQYNELSEYTEGFANGHIPFLLLVGIPGSGKSQQMKADVGRKCTWIDNHVTTLALYCTVYEAKNKPVVLDDVNHFLKNKISCSLIKALTQTDKTKHISWESPVKYLEEREVPREYTTSSPICLIANLWNCQDADMSAIQDRSLPVAFVPSAETIHDRVIELGWAERDVIDFVGDNLANIPMPSMREYYLAGCYKRAKMDWRKKLMSVWQGT